MNDGLKLGNQLVNHPLNNLGHIYGLSYIASKFFNGLKEGRLHHAWLIAGPQSMGKSTLVYRLAHYLLINKSLGQNLHLDPNHLAKIICSNCYYNEFEHLATHKQYMKLQHPDVMVVSKDYEINSLIKTKPSRIITLEEVNALKNFLFLTKASSSWKVVIIDGIESMNYSASNALLKMLEEPQNNTIIFLLTYKIHTVLPTIYSRSYVVKSLPLKYEDFELAVVQQLKVHEKKINENRLIEVFHSTDANIALSLYLLEKEKIELLDKIKLLLLGQCSVADLQELCNFALSDNDKGFDLLSNFIIEFAFNKISLILSEASISYEIMDHIEKLEGIIYLLNSASSSHLDKSHVITSLYGRLYQF